MYVHPSFQICFSRWFSLSQFFTLSEALFIAFRTPRHHEQPLEDLGLIKSWNMDLGALYMALIGP